MVCGLRTAGSCSFPVSPCHSPALPAMFSHAFYNVVHIIGIVLVMSALGAVAIHALNGGTRQTNAARGLVAALHGTGVLLILIGGFGMLALAVQVYRLRQGEPAMRVAQQLFGFSILYLFLLFATLLVEHGFGFFRPVFG